MAWSRPPKTRKALSVKLLKTAPSPSCVPRARRATSRASSWASAAPSRDSGHRATPAAQPTGQHHATRWQRPAMLCVARWTQGVGRWPSCDTDEAVRRCHATCGAGETTYGGRRHDAVGLVARRRVPCAAQLWSLCGTLSWDALVMRPPDDAARVAGPRWRRRREASKQTPHDGERRATLPAQRTTPRRATRLEASHDAARRTTAGRRRATGVGRRRGGNTARASRGTDGPRPGAASHDATGRVARRRASCDTASAVARRTPSWDGRRCRTTPGPLNDRRDVVGHLRTPRHATRVGRRATAAVAGCEARVLRRPVVGRPAVSWDGTRRGTRWLASCGGVSRGGGYPVVGRVPVI